MIRTPTGYEQFAAANLVRPGGKGPWATSANSYCVELVWYCGGFSRSFNNASVAANYVLQHHGLDPDWSTAQPGEFDYWGTGAGHMAMRSRLHLGSDLMASSFANSLAEGLGYLTPQQYGLPVGHGHTYMGHSPYFGDETLAAETDLSDDGVSVIVLPKENQMLLVYKSPGTTYTVVGNGAPYPFVGSAADVAVFASVWMPGQTAVGVPAASWDTFITANTPVSVPGGGATIAQIHTELQSLAATADLPTTEQLGEALTSTVSLVDGHVDSAFAGLVLKTT